MWPLHLLPHPIISLSLLSLPLLFSTSCSQCLSAILCSSRAALPRVKWWIFYELIWYKWLHHRALITWWKQYRRHYPGLIAALSRWWLRHSFLLHFHPIELFQHLFSRKIKQGQTWIHGCFWGTVGTFGVSSLDHVCFSLSLKNSLLSHTVQAWAEQLVTSPHGKVKAVYVCEMWTQPCSVQWESLKVRALFYCTSIWGRICKKDQLDLRWV